MTLDCRRFEARFEAWLAGTLAPEDGQACSEHVDGCAACGELARLARLPVEEGPSDGLLTGVLERTSGGVCASAERSLSELAEGEVAADDRRLLSEHAAHCPSCSGLVHELERLSVELPRLAEVKPQRTLVDDVLRATLPLPVRVRRWRMRTWRQWVRRPRFAAELAYAATLVVVVVFGTPSAPLEAMQKRAVEFARTESLERIESLQSAAERELTDRLQDVRGGVVESAHGVAAATRRGVGTIWDELASWFADDEEPKEETP